MKVTEHSELSRINEQHSKYIKIIDGLCVSVMTEDKPVLMRQMFSYFTEYSKSHLELEEYLMKKIAYPGYDLHLTEHQALRSNLKTVFQNFGFLDRQSILNGLLEIKNDLISHIRTADMPLINYYKEQHKL